MVVSHHSNNEWSIGGLDEKSLEFQMDDLRFSCFFPYGAFYGVRVQQPSANGGGGE